MMLKKNKTNPTINGLSLNLQVGDELMEKSRSLNMSRLELLKTR